MLSSVADTLTALMTERMRYSSVDTRLSGRRGAPICKISMSS